MVVRHTFSFDEEGERVWKKVKEKYRDNEKRDIPDSRIIIEALKDALERNPSEIDMRKLLEMQEKMAKKINEMSNEPEPLIDLSPFYKKHLPWMGDDE